MSGFTKLSSSLIASSIWNEPDKTRIVWITMLAMADANGDVKASVVGLAHQSRESLEDTQSALSKLSSPDPYSGQKDMEGRRIVPIDGGWHLVTHPHYREQGMSEETRQYWREKQRAYRQSKTVKDIKDSQGKSKKRGSVHGIGVVKEEGETERKGNPPHVVPTAEDIYNAYPLKVGKPDALKSITRCFRQYGQSFLLERTLAFARARNGDKEFCPNPATWFNQERFNDDPETWLPKQSGQKKKPDKPWLKFPKPKPNFHDLYPT